MAGVSRVDDGGTVICAECGARVDATDEETGEAIHPRPDDVALCPRCGEPSLFTGTGVEVRRPTEPERQDLLNVPAVAGWMAKVHAVGIFRAGWHET